MQLVALIGKKKILEKLGSLSYCLKHKESLSTIVWFGPRWAVYFLKLYCSFVPKDIFLEEDVWVKGQYL